MSEQDQVLLGGTSMHQDVYFDIRVGVQVLRVNKFTLTQGTLRVSTDAIDAFKLVKQWFHETSMYAVTLSPEYKERVEVDCGGLTYALEGCFPMNCVTKFDDDTGLSIMECDIAVDLVRLPEKKRHENAAAG